MINSLKELQNVETVENLYKYYEESMGKSSEEIKALFVVYGIEISDQCAKECYDFCKGVVEIEESELLKVAGGSDNSGVPAAVREGIEHAISILDGSSSAAKVMARQISSLLKDLLNKPYNRMEYSNIISSAMHAVTAGAILHPELFAAMNFLNEAKNALE